MFRALVAGLLLICCAWSSPASVSASTQRTAAASDVYARQARIIKAMRTMYPEVEVEVVWKPCGQKNAFYYTSLKRIVLCTEMEEHPSAAIFFAAHEMGHAITAQMIDVLDEQAADELGALAMLAEGMGKELLESALYWKSKKFQGHIIGDDHPSAGWRAWFLACMGSAQDGAPFECAALAVTTAIKWDKRLREYR